jgi:hypothetical protein
MLVDIMIFGDMCTYLFNGKRYVFVQGAYSGWNLPSGVLRGCVEWNKGRKLTYYVKKNAVI